MMIVRTISHEADGHPDFSAFVAPARHSPECGPHFTRKACMANGAFTSSDSVRYNQVRARASHNSYQRTEDILDQMVFWHLRSILQHMGEIS